VYRRFCALSERALLLQLNVGHLAGVRGVGVEAQPPRRPFDEVAQVPLAGQAHERPRDEWGPGGEVPEHTAGVPVHAMREPRPRAT